MRLAQISRKINKKPTEVLSYIQQEFNIQLAPKANTKIPEDLLEKIINHFEAQSPNTSENTPIEEVATEAPTLPEVEEEATTEKEPETIAEVTPEVAEESVAVAEVEAIEEVEIEEKEVQADLSPEAENTPQIETEDGVEDEVILNIENGVIRVPKVAVEGIKVIGKMDIASPKKEEEEEPEEEAAEHIDKEDTSAVEEPTDQQKMAAMRAQKPHVQRSKKNKRKAGTHLSFEEQRQKAEAELKLELKKKAASQKKKRKQHYQQTMKKGVSSPSKKSNKKGKKTTSAQKNQVKAAPRPTSIWGKFIYWLNN